MKLNQLLHPWCQLPLDIDCTIKGLSLDSRHIEPHYLFFALQGTKRDGSAYIAEAIQKGATAIVLNSETDETAIDWRDQIPCIAIPRLSQQVGPIAAHFYDNPSQKLTVIGVTGTNGKTSCTHFIADVYTQLGKRAAVIGTLGYGLPQALRETGLTTPDAISLQAILADFVKNKIEVVAMEVSSHSIAQGRIHGIQFAAGVFTNLTQDHLDYHGTMAAYAAVKYAFLASPSVALAVLNDDDAYGKQWLPALRKIKKVYGYSCNSSHDDEAVLASDIETTEQQIHAKLTTCWGKTDLTLPLVGMFNLSNGLAVLTTLCALTHPLSQVSQALNHLQAVPGRMQQLGGGHSKPLVVVDYAHTPDALEKVLATLKQTTRGALWCVFGCGGERDAAKRPLMAKAVEQYADCIILTNDNPRHEPAQAIAADILAGFIAPKKVQVLLDRSQAIEKSIQSAQPGDTILIAGRGAERYQQIGAEKRLFDDVVEVKRYLGLK